MHKLGINIPLSTECNPSRNNPTDPPMQIATIPRCISKFGLHVSILRCYEHLQIRHSNETETCEIWKNQDIQSATWQAENRNIIAQEELLRELFSRRRMLRGNSLVKIWIEWERESKAFNSSRKNFSHWDCSKIMIPMRSWERTRACDSFLTVRRWRVIKCMYYYYYYYKEPHWESRTWSKT